MKTCDSFDSQLLIIRTNSYLSVGAKRPLSSNGFDMVLGTIPLFTISYPQWVNIIVPHLFRTARVGSLETRSTGQATGHVPSC